jgi:hypothetical protein
MGAGGNGNLDECVMDGGCEQQVGTACAEHRDSRDVMPWQANVEQVAFDAHHHESSRSWDIACAGFGPYPRLCSVQVVRRRRHRQVQHRHWNMHRSEVEDFDPKPTTPHHHHAMAKPTTSTTSMVDNVTTGHRESSAAKRRLPVVLIPGRRRRRQSYDALILHCTD